MIRPLLFSCLVAAVAATQADAHHTTAGTSHTMTTVRIPGGLMAQGKPLPAGTYELIVTDEHPAVEAGTPSENQRWIEFVQNGKIVARDIAEMFLAAERPVGTSRSNGVRAVVQTLRGGEFVRVAINAGGARYLIHLAPIAAAPQN
jgi:hypothetical protein